MYVKGILKPYRTTFADRKRSSGLRLRFLYAKKNASRRIFTVYSTNAISANGTSADSPPCLPSCRSSN